MSSLFGRLNAKGRLYSIALKFSFIWSIAPQVHASKEDKNIMLVGKIHRIVCYRDC